MSDFNPNNIGIANGNYFALPYSVEESSIVLLSAPWDVTTSYRAGTHKGPQALIDASVQIDLYDSLVPNAWEIPIGTLPEIKGIRTQNHSMRKIAEDIIHALGEGADPQTLTTQLNKVNKACSELNQKIYQAASEQLKKGKLVGVIGGEHSVPLGAMQALSEKYKSFGILHVDAHADLRNAYEGFTYSHASIMYNATTQIPQISNLVQVGIRDFCQEEAEFQANNFVIQCFTDESLSRARFEGASWATLCKQMIAALPQKVYISFDIDGLSPELCPNTGTPVPGGLSFREADYLLHSLAVSGKEIIGFDLCEVAPGKKDDEWDANIGARLLYKLCCYSHLNKTKRT